MQTILALKPIRTLSSAIVFFCASESVSAQGEVHGKLTKWHPIEVWYSGPVTQETSVAPNPFLDYRLTVHFQGPSVSHAVPGYYDGNGAGLGQGGVWKAVLAPDEAGTWTATASFRVGTDVAVSLDHAAGTPTHFDGASVSFDVADLDPDAPGFLSLGTLEYVGGHYAKFRDGGFFLKGGTNSPENLFAFKGFDGTFAGNDGLHEYASHVVDWSPGDPNWTSTTTGFQAKGLIGALNYLSDQHVNSVCFLPMNLGGDGEDTWPFVGEEHTSFAKTHYDISKLYQWRRVFDHAASRGIMLHVMLAETELQNEQWLDNGALGRERKLFFRELVARFAHVPALKWNLSEENDYSIALLGDFADRIAALDAYEHPITVHNDPNDPSIYTQIAGDPRFEATSLQYSPDQAGAQVESYRGMSDGAGHRWIVEMDENGPPQTGLSGSNAADLRKRVLWDVYFSGGAGVEWYAGVQSLPLGGDLSLEDFRTREEMWRCMWYARRFVETELPFWDMTPADSALSGENSAFGGGEVFSNRRIYAVYLPSASPSGTLSLGGAAGQFEKRWYNPRTGEFEGSSTLVPAGSPHALGSPPSTPLEDWVVLLKRVN